MILKYIRIYQIIFLLLLKQTRCSLSPQEEENIETLNSQLRFYYKRFGNILHSSDPSHAATLQRLIKDFEQAQASTDALPKQELLQNYDAQLDADFAAYLQEKLDELHLNVEILLEQWFMQQLKPQLDANLVHEIASLLPMYEQALRTTQLDEKYELFANIEEQFSPQLIALLDARPEPVPVLNIHLQLYREYLQHLLLRLNGPYETQLKTYLAGVEQALSAAASEVEKLQMLDSFDDEHTPLGRFLDNNIAEFFIEKFSA